MTNQPQKPSISVTRDRYRLLRAQAKEQDVTIGELVRRALEKAEEEVS